MPGPTADETVREIDHAFLAEQTAGDADLARELLFLFAGQCRALVPGIADAALDAADRADKAHTLKGSAAGIGALRIRDLCAPIEDGLRRTGAADAAALAELDAAANRVLAEIEAAG